MDKIKQVIVVRTDLNMRKGKMSALAAHAAMLFLCRNLNWCHMTINDKVATFCPTSVEYEWLTGSFTKVVVGANSLEELEELHRKAEEAGLTSHLMVDNGETEFGGVKTVTALAIGPDYSSEIDPITGHLKLL